MEKLKICNKEHVEGMGSMKYLNDFGVKNILRKNWDKIIESIESAFTDPTADMVPKIYLDGDNGDFRAMPAALKKYASIKWIGVFPNNYQVSLPTTIGVLILNDRQTGKPLIAMDCTNLTAYRTAATSAIAARHCMPNNIKSAAFIGCGKQAIYHYRAYSHLFYDLEEIHLYDKNYTKKQYHYFIESCIRSDSSSADSSPQKFLFHKNIKDAVKEADLITTLTPSTEAYIDVLDLKEHCHINAVGADAKGKRELMTNVIDGAVNIICDDPVQALHSGELQYNEWPKLEVTSLKRLLKDHKSMNLYDGLSVFDSTGVALEDIALAILIYENYNEKILGS